MAPGAQPGAREDVGVGEGRRPDAGVRHRCAAHQSVAPVYVLLCDLHLHRAYWRSRPQPRHLRKASMTLLQSGDAKWSSLFAFWEAAAAKP